MDELTTIILSGIAWDAIKGGIKITANYIKEKLSIWMLEDEKIEKISECMENIPKEYCLSKGMIKEYLDLNKGLIDILNQTQKEDFFQNIQQVDNKIATGNYFGTINYYENRNEENKNQMVYFKKLEKYLNSLQENKTKFEYKGDLEQTYNCLKELFILSIEKIEYIKDEHESHCYLFSDNENEEIAEKMAEITHLINEYNSYNRDRKELCNKTIDQMDEIGIKVMEFYDFYIQLIRKKLNEILYS